MEHKPNELIYTNEQISQILTIINAMQIKGIDNLKFMSTIVTILEHPTNLQSNVKEIKE